MQCQVFKLYDFEMSFYSFVVCCIHYKFLHFDEEKKRLTHSFEQTIFGAKI